jgi:hypothetical protein
LCNNEAMDAFARVHGEQPGSPPDAPEQQGQQPQQPPAQPSAQPGGSRSSRQRDVAERGKGYLNKLVARSAVEFYRENAEARFPETWRTHLLRGKVTAFELGSIVERDRWKVLWCDGEPTDERASGVEAGISVEAATPRAPCGEAARRMRQPLITRFSHQASRAMACRSLAALEAENAENEFYER